jgi:Domain of unknown function (DUF4389)
MSATAVPKATQDPRLRCEDCAVTPVRLGAGHEMEERSRYRTLGIRFECADLMEPQHQGVSNSYPVTLEVRGPGHFDRVQVLLRFLVLAGIGLLHQTVCGLFGALYVLLPILAAILISQKNGPRFLSEDGRWLTRVLDWVLAVYAYLLFVTDRFPLPSSARTVRLVVHPGGAPTAGGALARLVTSVPHAAVLAVLGIASALVGFVAAIMILVTERYPEGLHAFQRDVLAWMARFLGYHASLVETYPPFSMEARLTRAAHVGS